MNSNAETPAAAPARYRLPAERGGATRTVKLGDLEVTFSASLDKAGRVREVFAAAAKSGDLIRGLLDAWCITLSVALQHGVPLAPIADKFRHGRFGPAGLTGAGDIARASSILDFAAQWLTQLEARAAAQLQRQQETAHV